MNVLSRHNVTVLGNGVRPIVFAHGLGCDQRIWHYITPAFEEEYKIILFDYIGSGKSDLTYFNNERYSSLNNYAEDVVAICQALQLKDIIFVGHSVSSMIGMLASIATPGLFNKIIMIGPSPCYINDKDYIGGFEKKEIAELLNLMDENYIEWANLFSPIVMGNADRPELGEELRDIFCQADPAITRQFAEISFFSVNRHDLPKLKTPSLIMQCSEDLIAPQQVGEYVHKNIPGSKLYKMNSTGHCPHLSDPEETIKAIKEYLQER